MLSGARMWIDFHLQAAYASLTLLRRKPLSTMMTVLVIAITLVLPALFWVLTDNLKQITANWRTGGHIALYLKTPLSDSDANILLIKVRNTAGVSQATLKSPAEGLAELQQQEGMQDLMHYLKENPLPAVIDVIPAINIHDSEKLQQLYMQLKSYSQVEEAKLDLQWINRLQAILDIMGKLADALMIVIASAVILIIGNTLRFAVHHRHEEIKVLKLIGAKDAFIIRPFLYSGIVYGLAGAIFAILLVNIFMLSLTAVVNQFVAIYQMHYALVGLSLRQILLLFILAISLGWLGACISVKRQLATIQP